MADASNGYWAVPMHRAHAYKSAFSVVQGQMCYLRMGQGLLGAPRMYAQLKDLVMSEIPSPELEPSMSEVMPGEATFEHFVNNNVSGATTFDNLVKFLHHHYFSQIAWSKLSLNPKKC